MMTKRQVFNRFRQDVLPSVRREENGVANYPVREQAWYDLIENLALAGELDLDKAVEWTLPEVCKPRFSDRPVRFVA